MGCEEEGVTERAAIRTRKSYRRAPQSSRTSSCSSFLKQALEEKREEKLKRASDQERKRLDKTYGAERAKPSERIMHITEHEMILSAKMRELGVSDCK